jgi:hypothetical protein
MNKQVESGLRFTSRGAARHPPRPAAGGPAQSPPGGNQFSFEEKLLTVRKLLSLININIQFTIYFPWWPGLCSCGSGWMGDRVKPRLLTPRLHPSTGGVRTSPNHVARAEGVADADPHGRGSRPTGSCRKRGGENASGRRDGGRGSAGAGGSYGAPIRPDILKRGANREPEEALSPSGSHSPDSNATNGTPSHPCTASILTGLPTGSRASVAGDGGLPAHALAKETFACSRRRKRDLPSGTLRKCAQPIGRDLSCSPRICPYFSRDLDRLAPSVGERARARRWGAHRQLLA